MSVDRVIRVPCPFNAGKFCEDDCGNYEGNLGMMELLSASSGLGMETTSVIMSNDLRNASIAPALKAASDEEEVMICNQNPIH